MKESQNLEFKSSWRDEYLKHICAFANTQGGRLLIGIDDHGNAVGLKNVEQLLEEIPNKAISYLGISSLQSDMKGCNELKSWNIRKRRCGRPF